MNCRSEKRTVKEGKFFFVRFMLLWETMQNTFEEFQFLAERAVLSRSVSKDTLFRSLWPSFADYVAWDG